MTGWNASVHLAERSTSSALEEALQTPPRMLHFATHTIVDRTIPEASAVVLTPGESVTGESAPGESAAREPEIDDGLLRGSEIERLDVPVDLVVLSSCRSGDGLWIRGEGVLGLARSFLAAGAGGVVATLWPVDDRTSAVFMTRFYAGLAGGQDPASALRNAKLSFLGRPETAHPRHWGAWILIGDNRAVVAAPRAPDAPRRRLWWPPLVAGVLAAGLITRFLARRRS